MNRPGIGLVVARYCSREVSESRVASVLYGIAQTRGRAGINYTWPFRTSDKLMRRPCNSVTLDCWPQWCIPGVAVIPRCQAAQIPGPPPLAARHPANPAHTPSPQRDERESDADVPPSKQPHGTIMIEGQARWGLRGWMAILLDFLQVNGCPRFRQISGNTWGQSC